jgi:hypothetical protein
MFVDLGKPCVAAALLVAALELVGGRYVTAAGPSQFRKLAPGVETTIPVDLEPQETASSHAVVEIRSQPRLEWKPNFTPEARTLWDMSTSARFPRSTWCLELTFRPLRTINVDMPQPNGKMQRKLIWYLVYRVRNTGDRLVASRDEQGESTKQRDETPLRFIPGFVLVSHDQRKDYLDRIIPAAMDPIRKREDPRRRLLNSVQMAQQELLPSTDRVDRSVWGVATWEDVDPRTDFLSVLVQGLTNAYRWTDPPGAYQVGDPPGRGRQFTYKTLQLNFWRPGDEHQEHNDRIRFGVPEGQAKVYGVPDGVDFAWVYR